MGMFSYSFVYYISRDDWCNVRWSIYTYRREASRCSFRLTGQCEGLKECDEQQVQVLTLLYIGIHKPPNQEDI